MTEGQIAELNSQQYGPEVERWYRLMAILIPQLRGSSIEDIRQQYSPCKPPIADGLPKEIPGRSTDVR